MKKLMKKINFAIIAAMVSGPAMAANDAGICALIVQMQQVFRILRTLAFVGAAFAVAGWAWGYISKGEVKFDDVQKKGIGMLVGFILLAAVGIVLTAITSTAGLNVLGCVTTGWN
ncbi:hypothetical protein HDR61_01000 [bacterium]|nr:hypothetical protein [bacterium]